ncbi:MAG: thiol:disulfide interchange protein TlpA, partial [Sediminibacterium sp.]|nr:thiol:disulfide interchange protein TlpA [Sediminibacterium sp.]
MGKDDGFDFFDRVLTSAMRYLSIFTPNSNNMRRSIFTTLALFGTLWLSAQNKPAASTQKPATAPKGRNISITLTPLRNCKVYLGSFFGKGRALVDSAYLDDKSHGVFKGPTKLTSGIYFVVS